MPSEKESEFYNDNDRYRFHLQFNTKDKDQEFAAQLLLTMGRKKSAFVATAIRFYMEHSSELSMGKTRNLIFLDREDLKDLVKQEILNSTAELPIQNSEALSQNPTKTNHPVSPEPLSSSAIPNKNQEPSVADTETDTDNTPSSDDLDLMLAGLDAFM